MIFSCLTGLDINLTVCLQKFMKTCLFLYFCTTREKKPYHFITYLQFYRKVVRCLWGRIQQSKSINVNLWKLWISFVLFAGTLGYQGTSSFVRKIYSTVKIDWWRDTTQCVISCETCDKVTALYSYYVHFTKTWLQT